MQHMRQQGCARPAGALMMACLMDWGPCREQRQGGTMTCRRRCTSGMTTRGRGWRPQHPSGHAHLEATSNCAQLTCTLVQVPVAAPACQVGQLNPSCMECGGCGQVGTELTGFFTFSCMLGFGIIVLVNADPGAAWGPTHLAQARLTGSLVDRVCAQHGSAVVQLNRSPPGFGRATLVCVCLQLFAGVLQA